jgi:metallo-beta-lactamase family protein
MHIEFHGADQEVTGSCHLVECAGKRILIDCGLYQGGRDIDEDNAEAFGFDPGAVDYVLLTHAHLDHCGRLPLLAKRGFHGEIVSTAASRELARLVMLDAAHLEEEEAGRRARHRGRRGAPAGLGPLYTVLDALNTLDCPGRTAVYDTPLQLAPGIVATFLDAGHILGSASVLLELSEAGTRRRVLFSGDLGNAGRPILRSPRAPPPVDAVVMETTYGDRLHKPVGPSVEELYASIDAAFRRGGNVIIPTFALERAQELLFFLRAGTESNRLPRTMQVFLDSPMAISATEIFERHPECYNAESRSLFREGRDPFALPGLHFVRETADSMALNRFVGGALIMAGSGMCTGGRVRHHLKHHLGRTNCAVVFVGYAGRGTLARRIIDGARTVTLFGEEVAVRASIHTINGFSAHADQAELAAWHAPTGARRTFLVHGEPEAMRDFAARLKVKGTQVEMPARHQSYAL